VALSDRKLQLFKLGIASLCAVIRADSLLLARWRTTILASPPPPQEFARWLGDRVAPVVVDDTRASAVKDALSVSANGTPMQDGCYCHVHNCCRTLACTPNGSQACRITAAWPRAADP
jgi:hypothetical protein